MNSFWYSGNQKKYLVDYLVIAEKCKKNINTLLFKIINTLLVKRVIHGKKNVIIHYFNKFFKVNEKKNKLSNMIKYWKWRISK